MVRSIGEYTITSGRGSYREHLCTPKTFVQQLNRKKSLNVDLLATPLRRCLTTLDITFIGLGGLIGAGIYILTGIVSKLVTGPSIVISYFIAGVTSLLAALCYAEFGARVPKAGSAYVYTYVSIGEVWAFIIGWDVILEQMIGSASVARGWSGYIDGLVGGAITNGTEKYVGRFYLEYFGPCPDLLAFGICIFMTLLLSLGTKGSSYFNSILTGSNLVVVVVVVCVGAVYANVENWTTAPGGFAPFGIQGVIAGSAKCFYAYVGFDCIATSGEEAKNPKRSIPLATFFTMLIVTTAYMAMSVVLTLLVRYDHINVQSAFPDAFHVNGVTWAYYLVSVGALAGMSTSLFGGLFVLPRCVYAMASDGLLFQYLAYVHPKTQTPIFNFLTCGILTALIAMLFDMEKLMEFMSIGTLMAYTIVSASMIILRYRPVVQLTQVKTTNDVSQVVDNGGRPKENIALGVKLFSNFKPGAIPLITTVILMCCLTAISLVLQFTFAGIERAVWWPIFFLVFFIIVTIASFGVFYLHHQSNHKLPFKVPWVPFIPACSIFCNIILMTNLNVTAWIRFAVWMIIGMLIYFLYGIHHSRNSSSTDTSYSNSPTLEMTAFDDNNKIQISNKITPIITLYRKN